MNTFFKVIFRAKNNDVKMVKLFTSEGKVLHTKDVVKHLVFNIGEDIEGNFYPNHVDFYICFGTWHTEKGAIYIAFMVLLIFMIDIIIAIITRFWNLLPFVGLFLPIEIILIYGIKKDKEKLILPHLIVSILMVLFGFVILILMCVAVATPHVFFYGMITTMFMTTNYKQIQLACLLYALAILFTMSLLFWINWSLYIHYRYIKGLKTSTTERSQIIV